MKKGHPKYKLIIDGVTLFITEDLDLFIQVREEVKAYMERYGKQGVEDFIDMLKENML